MAKPITISVIVLIAVVICVARMFIAPTHVSAGGSYQAIAHLFVGGLIGAWMMSRPTTKIFHELEEYIIHGWRVSPPWAANEAQKSKSLGRNLLFVAVAMSVVEVAVAYITRM